MRGRRGLAAHFFGPIMITRLFLLLMFCLAIPAYAALDPAAVRQLAAEESDDKITAIRKIALTAEPEALALLQQLADGSLKDDKGKLYIVPTAALAYLEVGSEESRRIGFVAALPHTAAGKPDRLALAALAGTLRPLRVA